MFPAHKIVATEFGYFCKNWGLFDIGRWNSQNCFGWIIGIDSSFCQLGPLCYGLSRCFLSLWFRSFFPSFCWTWLFLLGLALLVIAPLEAPQSSETRRYLLRLAALFETRRTVDVVVNSLCCLHSFYGFFLYHRKRDEEKICCEGTAWRGRVTLNGC